MNSPDGNSDFTVEFGLRDVRGHSMADANSDEIFNVIAETISSELKPTDQPGLSYINNNLASTGALEHDISHVLGNDIVDDALFTASVPVMDDYILPNLHDHDQSFMNTSNRDTEQSNLPKKRKNKGNREDEDSLQTAKKPKVNTVRDPNAVSKVVPWETW